MTIIDSQVHAYDANTPTRLWRSLPNWPDHVTGDEMVAAMDKVGVDGAIFVSAFTMYRYDASYAMEVQHTHPDRFAIVKPVDPDDPAVADIAVEPSAQPDAILAAPQNRFRAKKKFCVIGVCVTRGATVYLDIVSAQFERHFLGQADNRRAWKKHKPHDGAQPSSQRPMTC